MSDYIVIRAGHGLPEGFLPPDWDGRWIDRRNVPIGLSAPTDGAVAVPSGRFEVREDGAVAEVWELRP